MEVTMQPTIRLWMIRQGLQSEARGMRLTRKAPSCVAICKKEFGLKARSAKEMLPKYLAFLAANGIDLDAKEEQP